MKCHTEWGACHSSYGLRCHLGCKVEKTRLYKKGEDKTDCDWCRRFYHDNQRHFLGSI